MSRFRPWKEETEDEKRVLEEKRAQETWAPSRIQRTPGYFDGKELEALKIIQAGAKDLPQDEAARKLIKVIESCIHPAHSFYRPRFQAFVEQNRYLLQRYLKDGRNQHRSEYKELLTAYAAYLESWHAAWEVEYNFEEKLPEPASIPLQLSINQRMTGLESRFQQLVEQLQKKDPSLTVSEKVGMDAEMAGVLETTEYEARKSKLSVSAFEIMQAADRTIAQPLPIYDDCEVMKRMTHVFAALNISSDDRKSAGYRAFICKNLKLARVAATGGWCSYGGNKDVKSFSAEVLQFLISEMQNDDEPGAVANPEELESGAKNGQGLSSSSDDEQIAPYILDTGEELEQNIGGSSEAAEGAA